MKEGYRRLSKELMTQRDSFILEKRALGWPLEQIAAQTNLGPKGVEAVLARNRKRERDERSSRVV